MRNTLRITGLVAAMNRVRAQWQAGVLAGDTPAFRRMVADTVAQVEQSCRERRKTPRQLPPQSYRAYQYLKSLDLDAVPIRVAGALAPAGVLRIRNLGTWGKRIQAELLRIARAAEPLAASIPHIANLLAEVRSQAADVEAICSARRASPSALPTPSRRIYQWLKYLSVEANLLRLLGTLREAAEVIAGLAWLCEVGADPARVTFELLPSNYIYRTRVEGKQAHIIAAPGFAGAPRAVLEAVVRAAFSRRQRKARTLVKTYTSGEAFAEESLNFELAAGLPQETVRGRAYDLEEVFAQVNAEYFGGLLTRPHLTWSKTVTWHTLGHYHAESDTVMISITLDSPAAPDYAIAFVMYHELLHRQLGVPLVNGRRRAHNSVFRAAERRFKQYSEAEAALKQLARS